MSKKALEQSQEETYIFATIANDVDNWFSAYFKAFIDISAGSIDPNEILVYWSVPLHSSSPKHSKWLQSPEEVVNVLREMQEVLKQAGYVYTVAIDKKITIYNKNAGRVETIMSRRGGNDVEVDRAAISFELRCEDKEWAIISTTAQPTKSMKLQDIW